MRDVLISECGGDGIPALGRVGADRALVRYTLLGTSGRPLSRTASFCHSPWAVRSDCGATVGHPSVSD